MGDASAAEQLPLLDWNAALLADRKRHQDTRIGRITQHGVKALAQRIADSMSGIHRSAQPCIQPSGRSADMPRRTHATLEQPGLVVETLRVVETMGPLEAHDEAPALAGPDQRQGRLRAARWVPRQQQVLRHACGGGVEIETKTQPLADGLRQIGHPPGHLDIDAFQIATQCVVKPPLRPQ